MSGLPVKISVIIPVYNVEKYLSSCLTSCINQTLYDVEFICVNDGSTDNSLKILEQFAQIDPRIKIIDQPNSGVSSARNAGLDAANGEFIMFLDADDYLDDNACERVWLEILEAPTDIVIFGAKVFPVKPKPDPWYYYVLCTPTRRYWEFTPQVLFGEPSTKPFLWHQAYRRQIIEENKIRFDKNIRQGEDMIFLLSVYPHGKYFAFIQDGLYNYRWYREGSAMWLFQSNTEERVCRQAVVVDKVCEYWDEQGWLKLYGKEFVQWALQFLATEIRKSDSGNAEDYARKLRELFEDYELMDYLKKMPAELKPLVKTVKRGAV